jgi:cytochrome c553
MRRYVKAKRVAVAGVCHNCHEHHGIQAEPQAMADPARCASEPRPYLRHSALTNTCEALAMYLP